MKLGLKDKAGKKLVGKLLGSEVADKIKNPEKIEEEAADSLGLENPSEVDYDELSEEKQVEMRDWVSDWMRGMLDDSPVASMVGKDAIDPLITEQINEQFPQPGEEQGGGSDGEAGDGEEGA